MTTVEREQIGDKPPVRGRILGAAALALGAPLAFLLALGVRYLFVRPACGSVAGRALLELSTLVVLLVSAAIAWQAWRRIDGELRAVDDSATEQSRFVLTGALLLGAFCLLAGVALWLPSFFLTPCGRP